MTANIPELFIPSHMPEKGVMAELFRFAPLFLGPLACSLEVSTLVVIPPFRTETAKGVFGVC